MGVLVLMIVTPLLALLAAGAKALVVFWPVMLIMGALHTYWDVIPALPWQASFLLVMVITLLFMPFATNDID